MCQVQKSLAPHLVFDQQGVRLLNIKQIMNIIQFGGWGWHSPPRIHDILYHYLEFMTLALSTL
jgi:hypothetical protein